MKRASIVAAALCLIGAACLQGAQPAPASFDGRRAFQHLRDVVAIGARPAGSPAAARTRAYITKELAAVGLEVEEQSFTADTPAGPIQMVNLRATIAASGDSAANRPGRLIVAGHYDTKRFAEFQFVGANDAGSSTALLIELARALKNRRNQLPIELLFLDGEEAVGEWRGSDHTYGSRHYVEAARRSGTLNDIRALILVDMIGDRELVIKREANSTEWLTDAIWATAKRLGRREFSDAVTTIEDDHLEFLEAGIPAVDLIDLEYPNASDPARYWHTREDTLDKCSAASLQAVGDVLLASLPDIEKRLTAAR